MGCCSSSESYIRPRSLDHHQRDDHYSLMLQQFSKPDESQNSSHLTQDSDPGEDLLDTVTFDRLQYTRELMETGNWITKQEGNGICIKYIMGSKFNPHLHVTWMEIDFGENLDIRLPFVALQQFEHRKAWDEGIRHMDLTPLSNIVTDIYIQLKMPFPFKDRDFMERHSVLSCQDQIQVIYYSIDAENLSRFERAKTLFGYTRIYKEQDRLKLVQISQTDISISFNISSSITIAVRQMRKWAEKLKKYVTSDKISN